MVVAIKETKPKQFQRATEFTQAWNEHDLDRLGELYAPAVVSERLSKKFEGKDAIKEDRASTIEGIPGPDH